MNKEELLLLISEGECLTVEFKEKYTPKIIQDIVAFANSKGGRILLGVADDGKIKGETLTGELKAEIFSLARNSDPKLEVSLKQVGEVVVVTVDEGDDRPYSCSGSYYKRFDAVSQKLGRNEIKAIFESSSSPRYDEKLNEEASIEDISLEKVRSFYKEANIKYEVTQESLPNILRSLNLMKKNSITNAGVLFFAERMDSFFLHSQVMLLVFKDYVGTTIFDRKEVRGELLLQFNEAEFFLKRHLSLQAIIESGSMRRRNVYEVPQEAWREAIANAIIHRDYRKAGTSIQVRVFPDRIEIINPGRPPAGITSQNIGKISSRRNEIIADMFARLDIVEKAGTGIYRIREAMKHEGLRPPVFEEDEADFFKITLFRPKGITESARPEDVEHEGNGVKTSQKTALKTSQKTALKIIELMSENPNISIVELASTIGLSERAIKYQIEKLKNEKKIKRIGPDKGGYWEVTDTKGKRNASE